MSDKKQTNDVEKMLLLKNLFEQNQNKRMFKSLDTKLMQKRFANVVTLSTNENILNLNSQNITIKEIMEIINKFLKIKKISSVFSDRTIYEIVKLSNITSKRLLKSISSEKICLLCSKLSDVSHETKYISFDFLILHIVCNFISKISDVSARNKLITLKKETCDSLIKKDYQKENKNKPTNYLCWIDLLLNLTIARDLSINNYILVSNKICVLTPKNPDVLWKMISSASVLLQVSYFCDNSNLRNFKRNLLKKVDFESENYVYDQSKITELLLKTFAEQTIKKEDYYYLFTSLKSFSKNNTDDKLYCFNLLNYIFYRHTIKSIFSYRHIRENFLKTLFDIIDEDYNIEVNTLSFLFLCKLLIDKENFELYSNDLFNKAICLLKKISDDYNDISPQKFYKYCNILNYLTKWYNVNNTFSLSDVLANAYHQPKLIKKHLKTSTFKYSV